MIRHLLNTPHLFWTPWDKIVLGTVFWGAVILAATAWALWCHFLDCLARRRARHARLDKAMLAVADAAVKIYQDNPTPTIDQWKGK